MTTYTPAELGITDADVLKLEGIRFYDVREEPFRVYGLYDYKNEPEFRRMPKDVAEAVSPAVANLSRMTAGGRVRFSTSSPYVAIFAENQGVWSYCAAMSDTGTGGFDLYAKRSGRDSWCASYRVPACWKGGTLSLVRWLHGDKNARGEFDVTLNMPVYAGVKRLLIGLAPNASLSRREDYRVEKPVLFLGSSITQGGHVSRPGMAYEALISRRLDCNFVNLGFAGACRGEDAMIEYIAAQDCSVFVLDYDHNAPNEAHLAATHEKLYLAFRASHPDVPVVMVTKPDAWLWHAANQARRDVIYRTYDNARRRGEKVVFVDGQSLFAGELREECTTDGCHPNDLGMSRMADVIGKAVDFALSM